MHTTASNDSEIHQVLSGRGAEAGYGIEVDRRDPVRIKEVVGLAADIDVAHEPEPVREHVDATVAGRSRLRISATICRFKSLFTPAPIPS